MEFFRDILRKNIQSVLKEKKIKQVDIANHLNISPKALSEMLNKEGTNSVLDYIDAIAEFAGVSVWEIVLWDNQDFVLIDQIPKKLRRR